MEYVYRFRPLSSVLGEYEELKLNEIFFSSLNDLNDPMEGFKNMVWSGDTIAWQNFLKHFILCMEHVYQYCSIAGIDDSRPELIIPVFKTFQDIDTPEYKKIIEDIFKLFLNEKGVSDLPSLLAKRTVPVTRKELSFHLSTVYLLATKVIQDVYYNHGLLKKRLDENIFSEISESVINSTIFASLNKISQSTENLEAIVHVTNTMNEQASLIARINGITTKSTPTRDMLLYDFVDTYLRQLEKLLYPDWYVACFSKLHTSPSMWAHYAGGHTGICLKFKVNKDHEKYSLPLFRGSSKANYELRDVKYEKSYQQIDFFRSIGRLSASKLKQFWYSNEKGEISQCASDVLNREKEWQGDHWNNFHITTSSKLIDWEYEEETRLIITDTLSQLDNPNTRKLKYPFEALEGLIFGLNTRFEDKLTVLKIIEQKCKKHDRHDFKFYQSYYSSQTGKIEAYEMNMLNFK